MLSLSTSVSRKMICSRYGNIFNSSVKYLYRGMRNIRLSSGNMQRNPRITCEQNSYIAFLCIILLRTTVSSLVTMGISATVFILPFTDGRTGWRIFVLSWSVRSLYSFESIPLWYSMHMLCFLCTLKSLKRFFSMYPLVVKWRKHRRSISVLIAFFQCIYIYIYKVPWRLKQTKKQLWAFSSQNPRCFEKSFMRDYSTCIPKTWFQQKRAAQKLKPYFYYLTNMLWTGSQLGEIWAFQNCYFFSRCDLYQIILYLRPFHSVSICRIWCLTNQNIPKEVRL